MHTAPRTMQAHATNFRKPASADRAAAMADRIVQLCRAGKTEITDIELQEAGFSPQEIQQFGPRARSLAGHRINRNRVAA